METNKRRTSELTRQMAQFDGTEITEISESQAEVSRKTNVFYELSHSCSRDTASTKHLHDIINDGEKTEMKEIIVPVRRP